MFRYHQGAGQRAGANGTLVVTARCTTSCAAADTNGSAYGIEQAALSEAWYGDGLAWTPAVNATRDQFGRFPDL